LGRIALKEAVVVLENRENGNCAAKVNPYGNRIENYVKNKKGLTFFILFD
jgi:hypothetical protein